MHLLDLIADLFARFGPWPVVLIVTLYVVLNARFTFTYPREVSRAARDDITHDFEPSGSDVVVTTKKDAE